MPIIELRPELEELITNIGNKNTYYGNKIPESIMKMFEIVEEQNSIGILAPFWIGILQKGRGPRKSNTSSGLALKIYNWMSKRGLFRSKTKEGRISEAKGMAWYINKYGTKHFRSKVFIDVYETERKKTIEKIMNKYNLAIGKITREIL